MSAIDCGDWHPEVPPVMDTKGLAELVHTNEQIIRSAGISAIDGGRSTNQVDKEQLEAGARHNLQLWTPWGSASSPDSRFMQT